MLTIICFLAIAAFISVILALIGKCPLSIPVLLLTICELIHCIPMR